MSRVFDPPWLRALAALVGIALCVAFGWVLVAGPELPSFTPKTKTLVPGLAEGPAALPLTAAAATATSEPPRSLDAASSSAPTPAPLERTAKAAAAPSRRVAAKEPARKAAVYAKSAAKNPRILSGRPATLRINSRPWSEVIIDEKSVGPTPQLSISLEPGVHNVRLHNRQLNLLKILTLHVLPGETIDRVELLDP